MSGACGEQVVKERKSECSNGCRPGTFTGTRQNVSANRKGALRLPLALLYFFIFSMANSVR